MVASTDIKFYVHTNNNAPQLQNAYGSMINVLNACLVDGIQIGSISSLTASGKTVTATFSSAHNLMQYQVIKIAGAAQAEFNGEHRVLTAPNAQTITFELAAVPSVTAATGTITASLPPLGWEKPFSSTNANGGGKAAYRSKNLLLASRPFLRVVDELDPAYTATYAKFAKVGIVEDMSDINTMLGAQAPYDSTNPDQNWVGSTGGTAATTFNGWAKWYYAKSSDAPVATPDSANAAAGVRNYILIGTDSWFYVLPATITNSFNKMCYGFGNFQSLLAVDTASTFLSSTYDYKNVGAAQYIADTVAATKGNQVSLLLQRKYDLSAAPNTARVCTLAINSYAQTTTGAESSAVSYQGVIPFTPVVIYETGSVVRGVLPNLHWLFQQKPFTDLQKFSKDGSAFVAVTVASATLSGQVVFNLGKL
ncbi:hypothetical protein M5F03_02330 [Acinetobacter sp. ANC 5579]|uniref:hypothetical protein n=1 Tax=Acinetobacter amyesii TaxID=2942470 RepID=UPI0020BFB4E8|nr:hypothetical protein [Acinetobacter amyesii]MCL6234014.1 hypothetical protein [Acinetobacter amyesii]